MENGMNSIQSHDAYAKNKTRKRKGCLLWFLVVALAYVLLTLWAQWTPPVRGVVVDAETGQPIPNAEIIRISRDTILISRKGYFIREEGSYESRHKGHVGICRNIALLRLRLPVPLLQGEKDAGGIGKGR